MLTFPTSGPCPQTWDLTDEQIGVWQGIYPALDVDQECRMAWAWHVIQLQNGGQNTNVNLVKICGECHAAIHPWLERPVERAQHAFMERVPF